MVVAAAARVVAHPLGRASAAVVHQALLDRWLASMPRDGVAILRHELDGELTRLADRGRRERRGFARVDDCNNLEWVILYI